MRQDSFDKVCLVHSIEKHLDKFLQQFENMLNVASTVVLGILNIYCKNRWNVFYLKLLGVEYYDISL
jgi:hypothetical protein